MTTTNGCGLTSRQLAWRLPFARAPCDLTLLEDRTATAQFDPWPVNLGAMIAFERFAARNGEIYSMNDDGSGIANLTNTPLDEEYDPDWSSDGTLLSFGSDRDNGDYDLYVDDGTESPSTYDRCDRRVRSYVLTRWSRDSIRQRPRWR